ncbi:spermidine/putrescine transport system permease protein [Proteiniborus ethanoligenes]|uniref:Spermidine/putrescine transport system permease protein n=1 Tax=Proteiniborus ethanoligenes TaxID=415015 RepID=A0A1H3Q0B4_9FIRM|nr:ABC transporter permease [Proteiniborus ethanoligenes]TAH64122.1 MAG: ABC transporter permease [Gottschalkiaceae bacterium]SDZ06673.1 spermidine/putrescine transport system permease protein [Proteiniborus ethanoligenes]
MKKNVASFPFVVWIILFTVLPLLLVLLFSLTEGNVQNIKEMKFTLDNFKRFLQPNYINVLGRSAGLALISTIICFILGYPMAMILASIEEKKRNFLVLLFIVPMWMNFLLRTYAWMTLLGKQGLINRLLEFLNLPTLNLLYNNGAVVLGMVYNFLPFMVLPIYTVLSKIDKSIIEAAEDLGSDRVTVFKKIIFPLSIPGVVSGITMVFMPAVSTFVISRLLGGNRYMLIGNLIEQQFLTVYDWHFGSAISIIMMIMILIAMAFMERFDKDKEGGRIW